MFRSRGLRLVLRRGRDNDHHRHVRQRAAECRSVEAPAAREDGSEKAPTERLDPEKTYLLTVKTNCGTFTITLDQAQSPATAASLVSLARGGFFDNTIFHRIVPGFVIQGGDPTQSGSGGPGYQTRDVPPADAAYVKGVVAMAKTQPSPVGRRGASSSSSPERTSAYRRTTRSSAR